MGVISFGTLLASLAGLLALTGIGQALAGLLAARRFRALPYAQPLLRPPVTILKPLHGDEPLLEAALASVCDQDYPDYQVVFGVQDPADTALAVVARLRARFPQRDIAVVTDPAQHGSNRKIGNLINMFPAARHDIIVIGDSDVHCAPDFLDRVVATLAEPGTGLATTLYAGRAANAGLPAALGATWINHCFLPGALMARMLGRQDCLGATMALRRETLAAIGGLPALADHLADDHMLGRFVQKLGLAVRLSTAVVATTVPEASLLALWRHELRWARTILALVPAEFLASSIQFPIVWGGIAAVLSGGAWWAIGLAALAWAARAGAALGIDATLRLPQSVRAQAAPLWLLPLRDLMSIAVIVASYGSNRVEWRGQVMHTDRGHEAAATQARTPPPARAPVG